MRWNRTADEVETWSAETKEWIYMMDRHHVEMMFKGMQLSMHYPVNRFEGIIQEQEHGSEEKEISEEDIFESKCRAVIEASLREYLKSGGTSNNL